jgi:hypothetical protein
VKIFEFYGEWVLCNYCIVSIVAVSHSIPIITEAPKNVTVMVGDTALLWIVILSDAEYHIVWRKHSASDPEILFDVEVYFDEIMTSLKESYEPWPSSQINSSSLLTRTKQFQRYVCFALLTLKLNFPNLATVLKMRSSSSVF